MEIKPPTKPKDIQKSRAERRKTIFTKTKKLIGSYQARANFKEPILILLRRGNKAQFYENATAGEFNYEHSDGTQRIIYINPKNVQTFDYGQEQFKGYVCHEDYPTPLPDDRRGRIDEFQRAIDRATSEYSKYRTPELAAKTKMIWTIGYIIMGIIGLYILGRLLGIDFIPQKEVITQVIQNTSPATGII